MSQEYQITRMYWGRISYLCLWHGQVEVGRVEKYRRASHGEPAYDRSVCRHRMSPRNGMDLKEIRKGQ